MIPGFQIPMWRFGGAPNTTRTTSGTQTVPIPFGATFALIHCQGIGGNGGSGSLNATGGSGGGGAYARVNAKDLTGLTALYFDMNSTNTRVRENNSSGAIIVSADAAGSGSDQTGPPPTQGFAGSAGSSGSSTGDVKFSGAAGADGTVASSFPGPSGGGAAGSSGAASGNSGGPGDPSGGNGAPSDSNGGFPGGGGAGASSFNPAGSNPGYLGAEGYIRVVWS